MAKRRFVKYNIYGGTGAFGQALAPDARRVAVHLSNWPSGNFFIFQFGASVDNFGFGWQIGGPGSLLKLTIEEIGDVIKSRLWAVASAGNQCAVTEILEEDI